MIFALLFACYGVCFALQNKFPKIKEIRAGDGFFAKLFNCTYCTGFWSGLFVYGMSYVAGVSPVASDDYLKLAAGAIVWGFCSSAFCYLAAAIAVRLETFTE